MDFARPAPAGSSAILAAYGLEESITGDFGWQTNKTKTLQSFFFIGKNDRRTSSALR
jgi:hypothetical protein